MSLHEDADGLEVPTGSSEGTGRPPSARGRAPRPAGAHRDLRSARLGIKRALRDLRAGRISGRRFEALVAAHRNLAKIAMRQLREQRERPGQPTVHVTLPSWAPTKPTA